MTQPGGLASVPGVVEVEVVAAPRAARPGPPGLLIEVPHGATRKRHFDALRRRLVGDFPDRLEDLFFVNTDVGSIECARQVARMVADPAHLRTEGGSAGVTGGAGHGGAGRVLIVRSLIPRTFIDCNRVLAGGPTGELRDGLTPGLPGYVTRSEDVATLERLHADYQAVAAEAYATVCGAGGQALIVHTYAPRSVHIERLDEGIVAALHRAYEPGVYETWERRPDVDVISAAADGTRLAPANLVERLRREYAGIGITIAENATYHLHVETMGYLHSVRYPGQVLCLEINRALLADPFTPFAEMRISAAKARRMAAPIAAAYVAVPAGGEGNG